MKDDEPGPIRAAPYYAPALPPATHVTSGSFCVRRRTPGTKSGAVCGHVLLHLTPNHPVTRKPRLGEVKGHLGLPQTPVERQLHKPNWGVLTPTYATQTSAVSENQLQPQKSTTCPNRGHLENDRKALKPSLNAHFLSSDGADSQEAPEADRGAEPQQPVSAHHGDIGPPQLAESQRVQASTRTRTNYTADQSESMRLLIKFEIVLNF